MPLTFRAARATEIFSTTYVLPRKSSDVPRGLPTFGQSRIPFQLGNLEATLEWASPNEINRLQICAKTKWDWAGLPAPQPPICARPTAADG